jgi:hypothetical protein
VDRGSQGLEVMLYILSLKMNYPKKVFLLRGNHETETMTQGYGFRDEVLEKMNSQMCYIHFIDMFKTLPIAAEIVGGK